MKKILLITLLTFSNFALAATKFGYSGRILDSSDRPVNSGVLAISVQIKKSNCLLFQETHNVNMQSSDGFFSLDVGSSSAQVGNLDDIYKSSGTVMDVMNQQCSLDSTQPQINIIVNGLSNSALDFGWSELKNVSLAANSKKLDGKDSSSFIQVLSSVTQNALENVVNFLFDSGGAPKVYTKAEVDSQLSVVSQDVSSINANLSGLAKTDLSNVPSVPVSKLVGTISLSNIPDLSATYSTATSVDSKLSQYTKSVDLATVATSGLYSDLNSKPDLTVYAKTDASNISAQNFKTALSLGTLAEKNSVNIGEITSSVGVGQSGLPSVACSVSQTMYYNAALDKLECQNIQLSSSNVTGLGSLAYKSTIEVADVPDISATYATNSSLALKLGEYTKSVDLATVATTGAYGDLSGKPLLGILSSLDSIDYTSSLLTNKPMLGLLSSKDKIDYSVDIEGVPTNVSQFINDAGYLTISSPLDSSKLTGVIDSSLIPSLSWAKITSGKPTTISGYGILDAVKNSGGLNSAQAGLESALPAAGNLGSLYLATDSKKILFDNGTSWDVISSATGSGGTITEVLAGSGLSGGGASGSVSLSVNTGTGANQIVKLDALSKLPAVDGSLLTNVQSAVNFSGALSGDISGTQTGTSVDKIKGQTVTATGTSNQVLGVNNSGSALEYKTIVGANGVLVSNAAGQLTITGPTIPTISGTAPISVSSNVVSMPPASTSASGYLTTADWNLFNGKLNSSLASGNILVGSAGGQATAVSMTGDVGVDNLGVTTVKQLIGKPLQISAPTTGQLLKFNGTSWVTTTLTINDIISSGSAMTVAPTSVFQSASCATGQTLYYNSATDKLMCQSISITSSQIADLSTSSITTSGNLSATNITAKNGQIAGTTINFGATAYTLAMAVDFAGTVGYVDGSAVTSSNYPGGNTVIINHSCSAAIDLKSMKDGSTYTVVNTNSAVTQCTFTASDIAGVSFRYAPANAARAASSVTAYSFLRAGNIILVAWNTGFTP